MTAAKLADPLSCSQAHRSLPFSLVFFRTSQCVGSNMLLLVQCYKASIFLSRQSVLRTKTVYFCNSEVKLKCLLGHIPTVKSAITFLIRKLKTCWFPFPFLFFLISQLKEENSRMLLTAPLNLQVRISNMEKELLFFFPMFIISETFYTKNPHM